MSSYTFLIHIHFTLREAVDPGIMLALLVLLLPLPLALFFGLRVLSAWLPQLR